MPAVLIDIPQLSPRYQEIPSVIQPVAIPLNGFFQKANCHFLSLYGNSENGFISIPHVENPVSVEKNFAMSTDQFEVIELSQNLFHGTKPLEGKPLEVLNYTFERLRSKKPTRFE